jgi:hypothetical protein
MNISNSIDTLLYQILGFLLIAIIILLIREIVTWYWKINRIVSLLEKIERNTRRDSISNQDQDADDEDINLLKKPLFK